ncbi:hypothetical protein JHK82_028953 [Glycine max]|nr:hypothetical protein JHK85_029612 [Glycine max]KAG5128118.1 hypothetical protein JHK82_028953 [Glycine max]KAG5152722.1 hypothetical protein JHK84_029194 [Glycine max]
MANLTKRTMISAITRVSWFWQGFSSFSALDLCQLEKQEALTVTKEENNFKDVREQEEDNGGVHVEVLYGGDCGEDCSGGVGAEVPRGGGQGLQDPVAGCGGGEEGEAGVIAEVFKVALEVTFATKTVEGEGSCYNRYPKQIPIV